MGTKSAHLLVEGCDAAILVSLMKIVLLIWGLVAFASDHGYMRRMEPDYGKEGLIRRRCLLDEW